MSADALIRQIRAKREQWIDLEPGKSVKVRRPTDWEVARDFSNVDRDTMQNVCDYTVDWSGFSEAAMLGADIGSSDPLAFDRDLWREVASDRLDWVSAVAEKLVEFVRASAEARKAAEKN